MPTVEQLTDALRRADQAGDTVAARRFADLIKEQRAQEAGKANVSGSILPMSRDAQGNLQFDSNAGLVGSIKRAFMTPGDAYNGKLDPNSDEGIARAAEMAAWFSPITPAARTAGALPGASRAYKKPKVKPPTAEQLRAAAKTGYDAVRDSGVDYAPSAVKQFADDTAQSLFNDGIIPETAPVTHSILRKLQNPPRDSVAPISSVEAARRAFAKVGGKFSDPTDQMAANRVVEGLSDWMARPDSVRVLSGPADDAAKALSAARGNYAAYMRSGRIEDIGNAADLRAAAANSGQNIGNAIRSRLASTATSPKAGRGFSKEEMAAIEAIVRGSRANNTLRYAGNVLGGGGGLGQLHAAGLGGAVGAAVGGAPGAFVGAAGAAGAGKGAKAIANAMTKRSLEKVGEQTRMRSPLYQQMLESTPAAPVSNARQQALIRALLGLEAGQLPQQAIGGGYQ